MLSGGLDSSSILASLHHQKYKDIQTFNIGLERKEHNEAHLAKMMAENSIMDLNHAIRERIFMLIIMLLIFRMSPSCI
jgi:asparagine synthetase B (glutamine-hydrolysing)